MSWTQTTGGGAPLPMQSPSQLGWRRSNEERGKRHAHFTEELASSSGLGMAWGNVCIAQEDHAQCSGGGSGRSGLEKEASAVTIPQPRRDGMAFASS